MSPYGPGLTRLPPDREFGFALSRRERHSDRGDCRRATLSSTASHGLHVDFPLGSPCGEPFDVEQQRAILDLGFKLLEEASASRTTEMAPFEWSQGSEWKELVFTEARPWKSGEDEQDWLRKKALYKSLKAEEGLALV